MIHKRPAVDLWNTVDLHDDQGMRVLANRLSCTVGELRTAVQRVGPTIADVRNYVARSRALNERWQASGAPASQQRR